MNRRSLIEPVVYGVATGVVIGFIMLIAVHATNLTFGQRCEEIHARGTAEWVACLDGMALGLDQVNK